MEKHHQKKVGRDESFPTCLSLLKEGTKVFTLLFLALFFFLNGGTCSWVRGFALLWPRAFKGPI